MKISRQSNCMLMAKEGHQMVKLDKKIKMSM